MKKLVLFLIFLFRFFQLTAQQQDNLPGLPDTFFINDFISLVKENHPVSMQAGLIIKGADAEKLKARGGFDPKIFNNTVQKYYDEKTYYRLQNSGLKIPTWLGLEIEGGFENNDGIFLNDQNSLPPGGLWYAGITLPVGRGLFADQRRTMLRKAEILQESAVYETQIAVNDLLMDALIAFWDWYEAHQRTAVYKEAIDLAQLRFNAVRFKAIQGEEALIDTLEAYILYQNRVLNYQKAQADLINARKKTETYLWLEGSLPLELEEDAIPAGADFPDKKSIYPDPDWLSSHPLLEYYQLKGEQIGTDLRLNIEQLKPQVDLKYKFLSRPADEDDFLARFSDDNYTWGIEASFPLFLRKERGELKKTVIKQEINNLEQISKSRELNNKMAALVSEYELTRDQLEGTTEIVRNYQLLFEAETTKFENGESSLFLINQREIKFLESRTKQIELYVKLNLIMAKIKATGGDLPDTYF